MLQIYLNTRGLKNISFKAVHKKILIDFSEYDIPIDNLEGMSFGKELSDGRRSLLFVSDNNFSKSQETQFWLFSVSEAFFD